MECPHCLLTSPSSALRCDCGYDFQMRSIGPPSPQAQADVDLTLQRAPLPKMWIGFALSGLLLASEFLDFGKGPGQQGTRANLLFLIFVLASWIYWLWCVHRYHDILTSIPGYHHPISPGQAVARHFIPFYNFYWVFKWPTEVATFVNWRTQSPTMRGWIVGLLVLAGFVMRIVDASVGMAIVFCGGVYLSRQIRQALAAPPVPASAMARPGPPSALGLS
jgi:hypothetical protein